MNTDNHFDFSLSENFILIKEHANHREEIIRKLGALLYKQKFVKNSYVNAVLEREKVFPTGIATKVTGVAIPHTDSIHVKKSAIAIATLENPISFDAMGYPGKTVDNVAVIMMLAIVDPKKIMNVIRLISKILVDEDILNCILHASNAQVLKKIFFDYFE